MFLLRSWADLLLLIVQNPTSGLIILVVLLVILFGLSRLNNRLELRFQDQAIGISRGLVGTLMWFVIGPFIFFILLNIVAVVFGVPSINIMWLLKWLGTMTSTVWWLLKCALGSEGITGQKEMYTIDAVLRIILFIGPVSLIWIRVTSKRALRLALIPLVIAVLVITRHKKAEPTFITEDIGIENLRKLPIIGSLFDPPSQGPKGEDGEGMSPLQRQILAVGSVLVIIGGFATGLYFGHRAIGLVVVAIGIIGFIFIAPSLGGGGFEPLPEEDPILHNIDSLTYRLDSIFAEKGQCVETYEVAIRLQAAYRAKKDDVVFPDSLCRNYRHYFYEWCH